MEPRAVGLKGIRRIVHPDEPPKGVHHVSFSRVGGEVVMDLGFHDLKDLVEKLNAAKSNEEEMIEIDVTVFAQYSMAADTFLRMREHVEQIYAAMKESGHIVETETPSEEG